MDSQGCCRVISPIGSYLAEFRPFPLGGEIDVSQPLEVADTEIAGAPDPAVVHTQAIEAARRAGAEAATLEAQSRLQATIAELRANHEAHLAEERRRWAATEGEVLKDALKQAFADLEGNLAHSLSEVLRPLLPKLALDRATEEASAAIRTLLLADENGAIRISGPEDLLNALRSTCGDHPALAFQISEGPDVTVLAGETTIQSHMAKLGATLAGCREPANE